MRSVRNDDRTQLNYQIKHWTKVLADPSHLSDSAQVVTVNDRAATREAIIMAVRQNGFEFIERSHWAAHKSKSSEMVDDWDYSKIAIHHAGRSFTCGPAALQMQEIQSLHMKIHKWSDIGYHYAIDCLGNIYEGRDIRFKGAHLDSYNTGVIGVVFLENLSESGEQKGGAETVFSILENLGLRKNVSIPTVQKENFKKFLAILTTAFPIATLDGHREFPKQNAKEARLCPGAHGIELVEELREWSNLRRP